MNPTILVNRRAALRGFFRRPVRAAATVALVVALGGCGAYDYAADVFSKPLVLPCPKSWVVADAANLTQFREGTGRDLIDIDYDGEITGIELGCVTNADKKTLVGTMDVEVQILVNATRGPANRDRKGKFGYFVSVTDKDLKVLYREAFSLAVDFPGNRTRLLVRSRPVTLQIPIQPKKSSDYFRVFAGFTLSHEQLEFNRKRQQNVPK